MLKELRKRLDEFFNRYPEPDKYDKKTLDFHYINQAIFPDVVKVFSDGRYIFCFFWINGVEAYPASRLGRWYRLWKDWDNAKD